MPSWVLYSPHMVLTLRRRGRYLHRCNLCGWQSDWEIAGEIGPSLRHSCREGVRSMQTVAVQHSMVWVW